MTDKEKQLAKDSAHISTEEIWQDISDTEREIELMELEIRGFRLIGDRMSNFRAESRQAGIEARKIFIKKVKAILEIRGEL